MGISSSSVGAAPPNTPMPGFWLWVVVWKCSDVNEAHGLCRTYQQCKCVSFQNLTFLCVFIVSWRWKATNVHCTNVGASPILVFRNLPKSSGNVPPYTLHWTRYFSSPTILLCHYTMSSVILTVLFHCDVPKRIEIGKWQCSSLGHSS